MKSTLLALLARLKGPQRCLTVAYNKGAQQNLCINKDVANASTMHSVGMRTARKSVLGGIADCRFRGELSSQVAPSTLNLTLVKGSDMQSKPAIMLHYLYPPEAADGDGARNSLVFKVRASARPFCHHSPRCLLGTHAQTLTC